MVSFADVREVGADRWRSTRVREIAVRPEKMVSPRTPVVDLIDTLERVPVVEGVRIVGVLDRDDVMRFIEAFEMRSSREAAVRT
jgi:CBS domain-containing protein